jgi:hypothetical protein
MNVTTKTNKPGTLTIDSKAQTAILTVEGVNKLVAFVRDSKKVVVKNDMVLNPGDLSYVKQELSKFVKKEDAGKKRK